MPNAIIGSKGFIGSNLVWFAENYLEEEWIGITRSNYDQWKGRKFDKVIWAAGQSSKVKCHENPDQCFEDNYSGVVMAMHDFPARKIIYISSYDVYPSGLEDKDEQYRTWEVGSIPSSYYGATKFCGELAIYSRGINYLVLRCNGFAGPGLKKNAVYDIANDDKLWVTWDSRFQYIHVDVFSRILFTLASKYNMAIFNLTSPDAITPVKIVELCGKDIKKIKQPTDRIVPTINAVLPVNKLIDVLDEMEMRIPSSEEAVRYWNVRYPFKVQMPGMQEGMGR